MKFGLLGTGNWGKHYMRLVPEYGELIIMNREINPVVDCVIIATPASTHLDYIKQALQADKHILVEKPFVLSLKEAKEIKQLIGDKIFMISHQYCYNDEVRKLKPIKNIKLKHSYQDLNPFWEIAPHLFSVVDILKFKGKIELELVKTQEKIREWTFDGVELKESQTEPLRNEVEHFIDCIENHKTPLTDIEHGLRVIKNIEKYEAKYTV